MTTRKRNSTPAGQAPPARSELAIVWQPIEALKPDPRNPRSHRPEQILQLARSIEAFGFNAPILVDRELRVIAGHGRLSACRELGWAEVPTIELGHLSDLQARAFMVADNRLAENATWDDRLLAAELKDLSLTELDFTIEAIGFEPGEIELRIAGVETSPPGKPVRPVGRPQRTRRRADPQLDAAAGRSVCEKGDVWLLGQHRLRCGGPLDPIARATLIDPEGAAMVFTDADPARVDAMIRRWQSLTGDSARHALSGRCFDELAGALIATDDIKSLR